MEAKMLGAGLGLKAGLNFFFWLGVMGPACSQRPVETICSRRNYIALPHAAVTSKYPLGTRFSW